ncbi:MAG: 30S ribosomal protein S8 [Parcubacteria group bacterium]
MDMLDPISDMLTRVRNASRAGHPEVLIPHSKLKMQIGEILRNRGFIQNISTDESSERRNIKIVLKFSSSANGTANPFINDLQRVSREGQRIYVKKNKIPRVKSGYGFSIISTSKGLMTDDEARKSGLGGELICQIW